MLKAILYLTLLSEQSNTDLSIHPINMALYYTLYRYKVYQNSRADGRSEATALLCEGKQSRSVHPQPVNFVKRTTYRASSCPYFLLSRIMVSYCIKLTIIIKQIRLVWCSYYYQTYGLSNLCIYVLMYRNFIIGINCPVLTLLYNWTVQNLGDSHCNKYHTLVLYFLLVSVKLSNGIMLCLEFSREYGRSCWQIKIKFVKGMNKEILW